MSKISRKSVYCDRRPSGPISIHCWVGWGPGRVRDHTPDLEPVPHHGLFIRQSANSRGKTGNVPGVAIREYQATIPTFEQPPDSRSWQRRSSASQVTRGGDLSVAGVNDSGDLLM